MSKTIIKALGALLTQGSCKQGDAKLDALLVGLAHPSADGKRWIVSQRLLTVRQQLSTDEETIAALFATQSETRDPWTALVAARCGEAGQLADGNALVQLVTRLDGAAAWVEQAFPKATLAPTGQMALERELLGLPAEQAQATPILVRVLAAASLFAQWQQETLLTLKPLDPDGVRPMENWCGGRLLEQPRLERCDGEYILTGVWDDDREQTMSWVLSTPWAFLLAAITYVQDSWLAEAHGAMLLELPAGQNPHQPSEIQVLVASGDGDEVLCGSLGAFVLKILSRLNMGLFPASLTEAELNFQLSPLIGVLLQRRVWRYQEGLSGEQGFYQMHPEFSDACYQIAGARSFGLYGRNLRQAIREQAEQWRNDQQFLAQAKGAAA